MPEGDTILMAARALHRALAGHLVTRFESALVQITRVAEDQRVIGRTIESVTARGKHLFIQLSGGLVLHTHMRMNGSWHIYPVGARWRRPHRDMRVIIGTARAVAVGFNIPVAELLTARELDRHDSLRALGPDLLADDVDVAEVMRRMREHNRDPIAEVLLNQRVAAGIGNVFKSEILFLGGIYPFSRTADVADEQLDALIAIARKVMAVSVKLGQRTTRSSLNPAERLWVYGRGGKPCFKCGTPIHAKKTGLDARLTYWCPRCQAAVESSR
ncbi:MAG TPA: DNA-formamidopyrimidine glycosylase family protein [Vicinamibacterales bacterium]|nr:DNA-formamidopyrimidine glycosylase family protein [Vicinamibacterales bacterium]